MFLWLIFWFQTKHLIVDYLYQPPYMYRNKGTFGHPGGLLHALLHGFATLPILFFVAHRGYAEASFVALAESGAHYLIDYSKMNLNRLMGWGPSTSENFWRLLGIDQYLHQLCYLVIIFWVMNT